MNSETKKTHVEKKADEKLTDQLEDTFPASDPLTVTRAPAGKEAKESAASVERKTVTVSSSAEAVTTKK